MVKKKVTLEAVTVGVAKCVTSFRYHYTPPIMGGGVGVTQLNDLLNRRLSRAFFDHNGGASGRS